MASWLDWLLVDRDTGRIVIGQKPNALMLVFIAASAARLVRPSASSRQTVAGSTVRIAQAGALLLWALDEVLRGANPFRRFGGAAVLVAAPFRKMLR